MRSLKVHLSLIQKWCDFELDVSPTVPKIGSLIFLKYICLTSSA